MNIKRIPVQVNGEYIKTIEVPMGYDEKEFLFTCLHEDAEVQKAIGSNAPKNIVHMPGMLVNIITEMKWNN